ncbi:MAG: AMP-binding protein [Chitinispirillaceae bacterium]|nr:AMP-binding protein [Chitinispirillaceae bacterium]
MNKHLYVDLIRRSCTEYARNDCLHIKRDGHYKTWTYGDLHRDLNKLCSSLKKNGLAEGMNAAVIGENTPEWVISFHAILLTGACTVPVDPNIPAAEIEYIIRTTEAKLVFCSPLFVPLFRKLRELYPVLEKIIVLAPEWKEDEPSFYEFVGNGNPDHDAFAGTFKPDDPMTILFTSGTTGKAKGAVLCQKNYTAVGNYAIARMKLGPDDTVLSVLPLHHVFGFAASVAGPLLGGMDIVFVPVLKGPLILEALRDKKVTMLPAVPKMIETFYDNIQLNVGKKGPVVRALFSVLTLLSVTLGKVSGLPFRRALFGSVHRSFGGKLKVIISGGASLGKKQWYGFRNMGFNILEGYGLTETFGPITVCPFDDPRLMSVGPVLPENEIMISSPNQDGMGKVLLRGSCVFKGYYKQDELTREVFDADGWFITGDLGRLDRDGFLYLAGREKDVIVLDSGKNVYPDEVEEYYSLSPMIEELGIFGIRQEGREIVAAVIVPSNEIRKNHTVSQAASLVQKELVRLGKDIPAYRRITDFIIVYQPLPRTTTRKIKKAEIREMYGSVKENNAVNPASLEQLSVMETELMATPEFKGIVECMESVAERVKGKAITPRTRFKTDLGLDSLDQVALVNHLESAFAITVPDREYDKTDTVADLAALICDLKKSAPSPVSPPAH